MVFVSLILTQSSKMRKFTKTPWKKKVLSGKRISLQIFITCN